jgi:hypothetical protein
MPQRYMHAGDVWPLLAALPQLRDFTVRAQVVGLSQIPRHATLRTLKIESDLDSAVRDRLFAAHLPALEALELGGDRVTLRAKDIAALANNASLTSLRELAIRRSAGTQTILNALLSPAGAKLLARLDTLVLADGDLGDKAAPALAKHAAKLAHLKTFDLSGNPMTNAPASRRIDEAAVIRRTHDANTVLAARALADPAKWLRMGRDGERVWGEIEGRRDGTGHYEVVADLYVRGGTGCSCWSPRSPCKHALALQLLAARGHPFAALATPGEIARHARRERPRSWSDYEP